MTTPKKNRNPGKGNTICTNGSQSEERSSQSSLNVREERESGSITMVIPPGSTIHEWQTLRTETFILERQRELGIDDYDAHR